MSPNFLRDLMGIVAPIQTRALDDLAPLAPLDERVSVLRSARDERRRARRRRGYAALTVVGVATAAMFLWPHPRPLHFVVGGARARGVLGARVEAPAARPVALHFSDGTEMVLAGSASGRVVSLAPEGAHVVVESGSVRAAVVPRASGAWLVAVGPFDVRVKGTVFDAAWDPRREAFTLVMYEGTVVVTGRCLREPLTSRAGGRLELECRSEQRSSPPSIAADGSNEEVPQRPPAAASHAEGPAAPAAPVAAERRGPARAMVARASGAVPDLVVGAAPDEPVAPPDWRVRLAAHDATGALARLAEPGALSEACAVGTDDELMRLGEAARAGRSRAPAVTIYEAVRARFPGSDRAAVAAFHLGQVAFDQGGSVADARDRFSAYLAERPNGPLAAEALGRLLEIERRTGGDTGAAALAKQYLERFPQGPHAALARSLVTP